MTVQEDDNEQTFSATKKGCTVRLSRDPHPDADGYLVVEAPGLLVLFPERAHRTKGGEPGPQVQGGRTSRSRRSTARCLSDAWLSGSAVSLVTVRKAA